MLQVLPLEADSYAAEQIILFLYKQKLDTNSKKGFCIQKCLFRQE
jgi:hypothetical protein